MLGGFLALLAALTFAMNNASARRGVLTGSVLQALAISVPLGVPFLFLATIAFGGLAAFATFSLVSILWLMAAGIVHFVLGRYCNYRGTKAIGSNLVGPLQDLNIFYSVALAVLVLGEKMSLLKIVGFCLIVAGPLVALRSASKPRAPSKKSTFTPVYAEGYLFAFLSGLCYGTSPILLRQGLVSSDIATGVAASCISYCGATLVVALMLLIPGAAADVRRLDRTSGGWFLFAGCLVALSQMLRYMALAIAPVTVVAPIGRLSSVFRIYFSWLFNREHEIFSSRIVIGTCLSLLGALVLSLGAAWDSAVLDWPPGLEAALDWRWP